MGAGKYSAVFMTLIGNKVCPYARELEAIIWVGGNTIREIWDRCV